MVAAVVPAPRSDRTEIELALGTEPPRRSDRTETELALGPGRPRRSASTCLGLIERSASGMASCSYRRDFAPHGSPMAAHVCDPLTCSTSPLQALATGRYRIADLQYTAINARKTKGWPYRCYGFERRYRWGRQNGAASGLFLPLPLIREGRSFAGDTNWVAGVELATASEPAARKF